MATVSAFSSLCSICRTNPNVPPPSSSSLSLPLRFVRYQSKRGIANSFPNLSPVKRLPRMRKLRSVAEEETLIPEEKEDENGADTEEAAEASTIDQPVSVPCSPSDVLTMFFQAEGVMNETAIPAVTKALEETDGIANLKVQVFEGIASVEVSSIGEEIDTQHYHGKAPAMAPAHAPVKAPAHAPEKPHVHPPKKAPAHAPEKPHVHPPKKAPAHAPEKPHVHPPMKAPAYPPEKPHHHAPEKAPAHSPVKAEGCVPMCEEYCKPHHKKRPCMKACTACCAKCKCVPAGPKKCSNWDHVMHHGEMLKCP